jgi:hypothetical protein
MLSHHGQNQISIIWYYHLIQNAQSMDSSQCTSERAQLCFETTGLCILSDFEYLRIILVEVPHVT